MYYIFGLKTRNPANFTSRFALRNLMILLDKMKYEFHCETNSPGGRIANPHGRENGAPDPRCSCRTKRLRSQRNVWQRFGLKGIGKLVLL